MDDFKSNTKMACFKEGGSVKYKSRKEHKEEMSSDIDQDKKIVKKAFNIHDTQSHEGKKTDLSKLKKGGRAKKDCGTVKKYKAGGSVENAYGAKKTDEDIEDISNTKRQKPKMLACGSSVNKMSKGGSALKETDAEENPGLAKLPTDVRNKMGYMRKDGKAKKSC